MIRAVLQVLGILVLIPLVTFVTLRVENAGADGPSILFPGGELITGELHTGPEPDWTFTDNVQTVELQLDHPLSSRRTFVMESDGKIYVPSGYMKSLLGRLWKDWAFQADAGEGLGMVRIDGIRYERRLIRVTDPGITSGVAAKLAQKYAGGATPEAVAAIQTAIAEGETWIFELAPRGN